MMSEPIYQSPESGSQFDLLGVFQKLHQELEVQFDSLHTIEFAKLLSKFDNWAIAPEMLERNLPRRPEWAHSTVQLQDRITN